MEPAAKISVIPAQKRPAPDDAALVARALARDRAAEEILYRRHVEAVARTVMRLVGNRADAQDVVQETFVSVLEELDRLRDASAIRGWIMRIAVRKVHRLFRRRNLLRKLGLDRSPDPAALLAIATLDASPEVLAQLALLDAKLDRMPAADRIAWILRHVEGRTLPEVAELTDCSLATVKRRIQRAQERLGIDGGADAP